MLGRELKGTQDQAIIGNINRYAVNDQDTGREVANVVLDKRSMRETDLLAFEIAIKDSDVGTVMCAYNKLNGEYACENPYLLTDVLKKAWGYKGWIMSDWGGTHSTTKAVLAGHDQEQPDQTYFGVPLKAAVEKGEVPMSRLNEMVHRILRTAFAAGIVDNPPVIRPVNPFAGADVAQRIAEQSIVLLKNANGQLPLNASSLKSIAVIGAHADVGVLSGGGSDQVDAAGGNAVPPPPDKAGRHRAPVWHPSVPLKAIRARAPRATVEFVPGTDVAAAAKLAKASDVAIVFVNQHTREGLDVPNLSLPNNQDQLVTRVAAANPHTIVVLETGGPVLIPWIDNVTAILEAWYPGIRGAEALAAILFGDVNPSAKLPVSFPKSEADLPHPTLPGQLRANVSDPDSGPPFDLDYTEGVKVGYKWFEAEDKEPLFPFGFGLSYTSYLYSALDVTAGKELTVSFKVGNSGTRRGAEIAQVYAALPAKAGGPFKRLIAWRKLELMPGETKVVTLTLDRQYLSIFNVQKDEFELVPGEYKVYVGGSSRNTPLTGIMRIASAR
jgi:beta-glucosidase